MKNFTLLLITLIAFTSCQQVQKSHQKANTTDYTQYVNPFIGTSKMGHVFIFI